MKTNNHFDNARSQVPISVSWAFAMLMLILFPFALFPQKSSEENDLIVVRLATDNPLIPLYLANFEGDQSAFPPAYLAQLREVLLFDLNLNGMTFVVKSQAPKSTYDDDSADLTNWKALKVYYGVKVRIKDKKLSAKMLSINTGSAKNAEGLPLTGDLSQDRRQMHLLADTIHKTLFGTEGIASTHILFTLKSKDLSGKLVSEVWEADYDGKNARQITQNAGYCVTPVYMPPKPGYSCGSFFYVSYKNGQPKIYLASLQESAGRRFSYLKGNQFMPAISAQRDKVAFISDVTGNPDLFLQPFSPEAGPLGKPQQIFTTRQATQGTPAFSPDGNKIAFVSNKDGSPRIYAIQIPSPGTDLKDIQAQLISKYNKESTAPAWSPDGSKLAYCSSTKGIRQIWIYDFAKKEERQVTQGPGNKENPAWAPNSLHLVFNSTDAGSCELYLINLNQPQAVKISSGTGEKRFPNWEAK